MRFSTVQQSMPTEADDKNVSFVFVFFSFGFLFSFDKFDALSANFIVMIVFLGTRPRYICPFDSFCVYLIGWNEKQTILFRWKLYCQKVGALLFIVLFRERQLKWLPRATLEFSVFGLSFVRCFCTCGNVESCYCERRNNRLSWTKLSHQFNVSTTKGKEWKKSRSEPVIKHLIEWPMVFLPFYAGTRLNSVLSFIYFIGDVVSSFWFACARFSLDEWSRNLSFRRTETNGRVEY